ncbi:bifunctional UGMP family protein/serine/threonine protein kinase [Halalkalicoccus paucihalophilus]|uniref:non-specific serine/threonine protein kinase n=1 Tax=Halalkalicoccus paucihalophilus TaxID=1008153 RepID=A0A151AEH5_9EURY|nr:RIO1 family regulatory kinase/ATPase [Halalkalicoccus paucihalophilus]KYH25767.1 bifunctional UGMP family protein/serine/threonine protein kinase [Halalkalicoccus paucihalophilus]
MEFRRLIRGRVDEPQLERIGREIADRYDRESVHITVLEADNWLSTPCVVDEEWFVKVISPQNALVQALFTGARNLGVFSRGEEGFFERFEDPLAMSQHELEATRRVREIGLNAPEPIEAFGVDEFGVLMLEYLPEFRTLDELPPAEVETLALELFSALALMHDHSLAHGDLRGENVLVHGGELYFIDATNVRRDGLSTARAYDIACALATLEPALGARRTVEIAADRYDAAVLLAARDFLDLVRLRPDHEFEAAGLKGEIERRAD